VNIKDPIKNLLGTQGSFRRNSLIMSSGSIINIIVAFLLTPIVTRLYTKEEFGVFYIYASIVAIGTILINGMYPHAFVVPKFQRAFIALLKFCLSITFLGVAIFTVILVFFGKWFLELIGGHDLYALWYLLPIGLLVSALNVIFINWNVRRKEFKRNASSQVVMSSSRKGIEILHGVTLGGIFSGLIYADMISKFLGTLTLGTNNIFRDFKKFKVVTFSDQKEVLKEFRKYPTYIMGSNFLNKITSDIPLYLLAFGFGDGAVGAFGFANQMLNIPITVIGNSIAPVYFQRANELYLNNPESLRKFTLTTYTKMLIVGSLTFGLIFGFGDVLFSFVFSNDWELAGQFAMILSAYYVFKLISSPFARIFRVLRIEEKTLLVNIVLAGSRVLGITIGINTGSLIPAIICFTIGSAFGYMFNNVQVFIALGISFKEFLWKTFIIIMPIYGAFYCARFITNNFQGL